MKRTELNEQESKALCALADNGTGKMTANWWCEEHGATDRVRKKLRRMGFVVWENWYWCITGAGQRRADEERDQ